MWIFSSCGGILELRRGFQASSCVGPGKPNLPFELRGKAEGCTRVTAGPKRPHLGLFRDLTFLSREDRDLRVAVQTPPGSQASPRGQAKYAALLSSRDADLLEPNEWPQGSQAFSSVWREDSGLCSGSGRKRRPSPREDGGFSGVSSSCGARGGFLTRQDEDLREPLVRCQGSQVSVHVARGSASWLSSHGRGLGPPDALKKDTRGLSGVAAGKPHFPRLLPGT